MRAVLQEQEESARSILSAQGYVTWHCLCFAPYNWLSVEAGYLQVSGTDAIWLC